MSVRTRMIRRMRKNIMRLGKITKIETLNRDDDGHLYPKREWEYSVKATVNGYRICSPNDNWYGAYQGCLECARWCSEQPPFEEIF